MSPDDTVKKLPTKMDLIQAPQTKLQTQHTDSMPTVSHEQTMTPSADPTQEGSASKQSATLIDPKALWDKAYNSLRKDNPDLVEAYEKILTCELATPTASPVSDIQQNLIEQECLGIAHEVTPYLLFQAFLAYKKNPSLGDYNTFFVSMKGTVVQFVRASCFNSYLRDLANHKAPGSSLGLYFSEPYDLLEQKDRREFVKVFIGLVNYLYGLLDIFDS